MSSLNPRQAEANLELALYNAEEVDIFTNTNSIGQGVNTAHNLFNTAVELCSDPFSNDHTATVASCSARKLHPWVVTEPTRSPKETERILTNFKGHKRRYYQDNPRLAPENIALRMYLYYRGETQETEAPYTPKQYMATLIELAG